jgi:hypothetical protein
MNGDFSITHLFMDERDINMYFDILVTCWKALVYVWYFNEKELSYELELSYLA